MENTPNLAVPPAASPSSGPVPSPSSGPVPAVAPVAAPVVPATITYDDFAKIQLRIATVLECVPHPNADKLLVLQIDLGDQKRQICAGLKAHIPDPQALVGKQIVVVANLAPRQMRGQISQGMLLAASDVTTGKVIIVSPSEPVAAGSGVK